MKRILLAVSAGFVAWSALWVGACTTVPLLAPDAYAPDGSVDGFAVPGFFLLWSVVLSVLAGFLAMKISRGKPRAVWVLAGLQLTIGLVVEVTGWDNAPAWYHLAFLAALVPGLLVGAARWQKQQLRRA